MRAAVTEAETAAATDSCGEQDLLGAVLAKLCKESIAPLYCTGLWHTVQCTATPGGRQLCNREVMRAPARLVFPGGGIFFWWQAGAITSLSKRIDLSTVPCCGASAGSATIETPDAPLQ